MSEMAAAVVWIGVLGYLGLGAIVWCWLLAGGLRRIDGQAAAAPLWVKALWTPGMIGLWPLLLWRAVGVAAPEDRA